MTRNRLIGALSIVGVAMIAGRRSWYASSRSTQKRGINVAAVGWGTPADVLRDDVAAARYAAFRPSVPTACRLAAAPIAHAAC